MTLLSFSLYHRLRVIRHSIPPHPQWRRAMLSRMCFYVHRLHVPAFFSVSLPPNNRNLIYSPSYTCKASPSYHCFSDIKAIATLSSRVPSFSLSLCLCVSLSPLAALLLVYWRCFDALLIHFRSSHSFLFHSLLLTTFAQILSHSLLSTATITP